MIKIDHATFTYGENNEYSVGIRDIDPFSFSHDDLLDHRLE